MLRRSTFFLTTRFRRELRDILLFILAGTIMTYFSCTPCRTSFQTYAVVAIFCSCVWGFLWKGNSALSVILSRYIPWIEFPIRRLIAGLLASIIYTVSSVVGMLKVFEYLFDVDMGDYRYTIYSSIAITLLISLSLHSKSFFQYWRQAKVDAERFEKESILARYESLKSQVNPHFLFNSLNALTNLVYEDQDKAVHFIKKLSDVYRYVLDTRDREVVTLQEELAFLTSYIYLQQIRFGDKLSVDLAVAHTQDTVVPLSLQMLFENAIKHNIISEEDPLTINIYQEDHYVVVQNNLQRKEIWPGTEPGGLGLENIQKRYAFLTDQKVIIFEDDHTFTVKLPIIPQA